MKGYTEGWGTDTDSTGQCITGEEGPAPFQPCQDQTIIPAGDGGPPKIYQGCVKGKSPTALLMSEHKDGLCARLKSQLRQKKKLSRHLMLPGLSEVVVVTRGEIQRRCYHENRVGRDRRTAGWCATCRADWDSRDHRLRSCRPQLSLSLSLICLNDTAQATNSPQLLCR